MVEAAALHSQLKEEGQSNLLVRQRNGIRVCSRNTTETTYIHQEGVCKYEEHRSDGTC
jgi:hypothetical protein